MADFLIYIYLETQHLLTLGIDMFDDEDSDDNKSVQWEQEPQILGKGKIC